MARKNYRYSLNRKDAKLVGVCSTLGERFNIDPTFLRIGFIATLLLISWEFALVTYAALGIYFTMQRKREVDAGNPTSRRSEFDRMGDVAKARRPSVHAMRTELDETDRRLMAIDDHLATPNHELAREIEALRQEEK
jgi:phage shock protein PspC (stress-responsive transcriptional regulator)